MNRWMMVSVFLVVFFLAFSATPVFADGIIIPDPIPPVCPGGRCPTLPPAPRPSFPLSIRYHHVRVSIDEQIAVTRVEQVFFNPNDRPLEGVYIFPLPTEAAVGNFKLWMNGKAVEGKVLSAEEARRTYENIIRTSRDPALLEYVGRGAVQARIFPIPARGESKVELEYAQVLKNDQGLIKYVYPLNTEKFSAQLLESVSVQVEVKSRQPVRAVYSPSHSIQVDRTGVNRFKASYEASRVKPDRDFSLFYSVGETEAFHLLSYRDSANNLDPDGFFLMLLAPQPGALQERKIEKDVLLVLDRSGSMEGEKFRQAQAALIYILEHLNPGDRFHLMTFSSSVENYSRQLLPSGEATRAVEWVKRQGAAGSTDINRALLESVATADKQRPTYLIFLTDGLPTVGETNNRKILANFSAAAPDNIRLFAFGVGYDVDTMLLDSLTGEHHGLSQYVRPADKLDEILSAFYATISTPVLTSLELDFGRMDVYDMYPNPLPDLFEGSQVVVVGRYRKPGTGDVVVSGKVSREVVQFRYRNVGFTADNRGETGVLSSLPRLWATRKIGYLLNKIRLNGADRETIDQIVRLSIRYGIVTPYTSYLVTENDTLGSENQRKLSDRVYQSTQSAPAAPSFGQSAVEKAAGHGEMERAQLAPALPASADNVVRQAGSRTFVQQNGVWIDTNYDPKISTRKIPFLSSDYFLLAADRGDIAAALALGQRVILMVDGKAYEVTTGSEPQAVVSSPPATAAPEPGRPGTAIQASPTAIFRGSQTAQTVPSRTAIPASSGAPICAGMVPVLAGVMIFGAKLRRTKNK